MTVYLTFTVSIFTAQQKQDKLLMIARRTTADIPRADLSKQDDEGDT